MALLELIVICLRLELGLMSGFSGFCGTIYPLSKTVHATVHAFTKVRAPKKATYPTFHASAKDKGYLWDSVSFSKVMKFY